MTEQSNRDKISLIVQEMIADQNVVVDEVNTYLQSPEGVAMLQRFMDWRERTVPNGNVDQLLSGVVTCIESMVKTFAPATSHPYQPTTVQPLAADQTVNDLQVNV